MEICICDFFTRPLLLLLLLLLLQSMEQQLAEVIETDILLWLTAAIFLLIPRPSYAPFWAFGVALAVMLAVGAK